MSTMTLEQVRDELRATSDHADSGYDKAWAIRLADAIDAHLRERESAKAVLDALGYVPGELDKTAPERIWLQIDTAASNNDREEPWPGCDGVTWQDESMDGLEIQYVRADLVAPMLASARVPDAIKCQVGRGAYGEGFDEGWNACRAIMLAATREPEKE